MAIVEEQAGEIIRKSAIDLGNGNFAIRGLVGSPLSGISWDYVDASGVGSGIETYVFKSGGASGDIVRTIVVTFTGDDFIVEVT